MLTVALSLLRSRGVQLDAHEAVALARELLACPCGTPSLENVRLGSDGSASCSGSSGMPSVRSVADLLLTLLPPGTPNVPTPLRYAIARGVQAVEAPPFASISEFSNTLARFEKGASRAVLSGLLERAARPLHPTTRPTAVAPLAATSPAADASSLPLGPTLVRPGQTVVVGKQGASSQPLHSLDSAASLSTSPAEQRAASRSVPSSKWALPVAAALLISFGVSFAVTKQSLRRGVSAQSARSTRVPPGVSTSAANDSAEHRASVTRQDEIIRVPDTAMTGTSGGPGDTGVPQSSAPLEAVGENVSAVQGAGARSANAFSPAFASEGTAIFFHTGRKRDAQSAIALVTTSGGDLGIMTIVDDGSRNYHPQPSPDGRFVAFDSDRDGDRGVYVANRDGSHVRRLSGAGYAAVPTWSRDSAWLAYIRAESDKPSVWNLWVQPAAGGAARRVTNYTYGQTWAASWFPDGRRIVYSHEDTLFVMDLRSGQATRHRTPVRGHLVRTPAVSPDGTTIIFQVFRDGAWLLNLGDGSMRRVLSDPTAEEFAWAPDGRRIAFHSRRDGRWGIYVLSRS